MMHLEEIWEQGQKPDSTAGMMRFLVAHFPAVINKILPDSPPAQVQSLLDADPDYFNDIAYDDVVQAMASVLLVSGELYKRGVRRPDEAHDRTRYSDVKGVHFLPWGAEVRQHFLTTFNTMADVARAESRGCNDDRGPNTASSIRKRMTRVLQFMPPIDIIEKVIVYLLEKAGKSPSECATMSGEELVHALASLAQNDRLTDVLKHLNATAIPAELTKGAVNAAVALGQWFDKSFQMTLGARKYVPAHLKERSALSTIPPATLSSVAGMATRAVAAHVDPLKTFMAMVKGWRYKAFVLNPYTTIDQVRAVQIDLVVLEIMGFLVRQDGSIELAAYAPDSEGFVHAANRMQEWDGQVVLADLRAVVPSDITDAVGGDQGVADQLCRALKALLSGDAVDFQRLEELEAPFLGPSRSLSCPASQVAPPPKPDAPADAEPGIAHRVQSVGEGGGESTQVTEDANFGQDEGLHAPIAGHRKRLREEPALTSADFDTCPSLKKRILLSALKSSQVYYQASKNKDSFKSAGTPEDVDNAFRVVLRFLTEAGLGKEASRTCSTTLYAPPGDTLEEVLQELRSRLTLADRIVDKVRQAFQGRQQSASFDIQRFKQATALFGTLFQGSA